MLRTAWVMAALLCAALEDCATAPPPMEELTKARTLVDQASKSSGERYAAADLQRARDELAQAEDANRGGRYDAARRYAESAAVDADLANARAAAGEAQQAAREVAQSNATLRREIDQGAPGVAPAPDAVPPYTSPPPP
jgi:hypothetical protein